MWFQCNRPITGAEGSFKKEAMFKTDDPEFSTSVKTENDEHECDKKEFINKPTDFVCPQCCSSFLDIEKFLNHVKEHHEGRKQIHSKKRHMNVEYVSFREVELEVINANHHTELPLDAPPPITPSPSNTTADLKSDDCKSEDCRSGDINVHCLASPTHNGSVEKRQRLNSGMGRDFISFGDINRGVTEAVRKRRHVKERIQPRNVIDELGLIFSGPLAERKAYTKIRNHLQKRRKRRSRCETDVEESSRFLGVNDGILNILAVTSRLDSGHPDQNDPENTLSADQADSISTSSFVERITDNMNAFIYEIEESNNCRINKHEFLNVIAKRFLPGYEVVKKKPSLNSSSTLIKNPNEVAFD